MSKAERKPVICTRCGHEWKVGDDNFEYSQGSLVCSECKKQTLASDKRAFDRDMSCR